MVDRADLQLGVRLESEIALCSAGFRGPRAQCRPLPRAAPRNSVGRARANGTRCRDAQGQRGELQGNFSQGKRSVVPTRSHPAFCLFSCWRLENGRVPAALPCAVRPVRLAGPRGRPRTEPSTGPSRDCPHFQFPSGRLRPARRGAALTAGAGPCLCSRRQKTAEVMTYPSQVHHIQNT
ncbi:uncharacterized protein LOC128931776 isoform X2 [Callithrix jacchus]